VEEELRKIQNLDQRASGPITEELIIETGSQMVTGNRGGHFGARGNASHNHPSGGDKQSRGKIISTKPFKIIGGNGQTTGEVGGT
jgi:hypothetical protein